MIGLGALVIAGGVYYSVIYSPGNAAVSSADQAQIEQLVTDFGK